uniref:Histone deacetylase domain-containing protein n=1 Tax=Cucumis melo TaxID=3656 RepID=A0A9I9DDL7_CUCME
MSSSLSPNANNGETVRRDRILSSKLYFDVPSSKFLLGNPAIRHPFDSKKWGRVCQFLIAAGVLRKDQIIEPLEAKKNDLLVVHPESYLNSLKNSSNVAKIIEVPPVALFPHCVVKEKVQRPFRNQVGGSILAGKVAKEKGWAINVGGGFHHCSAEQGGGFCVYADISLCIHYAFVQLNISRVMIIDLDAHQGNGHEMDFAHDRRVYILDMFNPGIYPFSGTTTSEYLKKLDEALEVAATSYDPELIVYNAGTDILDGDPLGLLKISAEGIAKRDEKVFRFARARNIPIVMLTSGGYMKSSAKVIADSIENLSKQSTSHLAWLYFNHVTCIKLEQNCFQYCIYALSMKEILLWFTLR